LSVSPVELARGISVLVAPNPGLMTGPGTNTYLVGTGDVIVVDPGPDDAVHIERIVEAGAGRIRYVVATHTHADHAPGAAPLAAATGARVLGFRAWAGFEPDGLLADGDVVAAGGRRLRALHTPGHASDHLCYLEETTNILLSGDHVMGGSTVVIAPPDGDMAAYLASLRRVRALDPPLAAIAPGHGPLLTDPKGVVDEYIAHRLAREGSIFSALVRRGTAAAADLVADVYTDVPAVLHPVAERSVWAHLRKLAAEDRIVALATPDTADTTWEVNARR
jgi:glyoxylase-like metal-dependent hydrolase (beta-lactamase superfamily II)